MVTQVVMHGLVYYPFHFVEKNNPEYARKNCKVLQVVRREGEYSIIPTVFALEGSIEKKLFYDGTILLLFLYGTKSRENSGPNGQLAKCMTLVSFIKTGTYKDIGQRLTGFCVYVSVVVRRFATGDVFVYLP